MNLTTFKGKKLAAKKGYDLLKSKADALKVDTSPIPERGFDLNINSLLGPISTDHEEYLRYQDGNVGLGVQCLLQLNAGGVRCR